MFALVQSPGLVCLASMAGAFTFSASRSTPAARCTRLRTRTTQSSSSSPRPLIRINEEGDEIRPVLLFDVHAPRLLVRRRNGSRPRMPRAGPTSRYRAAEPACSCFKPCPTSYFFRVHHQLCMNSLGLSVCRRDANVILAQVRDGARHLCSSDDCSPPPLSGTLALRTRNTPSPSPLLVR
jgi:hypothetical protein